MKFKKFSILAVVIAIMLVIGACGTGGDAPPAVDASATTEVQQEAQPAGDTADEADEAEDDMDEPAEEVIARDDWRDQIAAAHSGDEFTWVAMSDPPFLDPIGQNDSASSDINSQMYEGLMAFTAAPDNTLVPMLATGHPTVSADGLVYTFELRQGVTFHNGEPFNADAVRLSMERLLASDAPARFVLEMIDHVEVVSDYVVNIHLEFAFAPFPFHLTHQVGFIIAPAAIAEEEAGGRTVSQNPIGTGPFVLDYRIVGDYSRLVPNPNHWNAVPEVSVMWRTVPDTDTRIMMLQTGEANALHAQVADIPRLQAMVQSDGVELNLISGATLNYIAFNTQRGALADYRVRQAVSMAINRENLLYGLAEGFGTLAAGPITDLVAYAPNVDGLPFDPARARELLEEAGFGDGLTLEYWYNTGNAMRARAGELVQDDLRAIGIDINITGLEWGEYLDRTGDGEHDMFYLGWQTMTMDADYGIEPLFHSRLAGRGGNRSFFVNERVDALLEEGATTTSSARRYEVYQEIVEILVYEAPMIFLFFPYLPLATNGLDNAEFTFTGIPRFYNATVR